ncbi:DEAD/DEAH box helicase family protein [Dermatophilaceae bacterium Soc4.6]
MQDANVERGSAEGAYAKRQLFELLQNASDAIRGTSSGRCEVILGPDTLYVANSGEPVTVEGVIALMGTHDSVKRDDKIGRFGLGFKSLLAVTDGPRVFSRSGSFAFDRVKAKQVIQEVVPGHPHYPVLRWAEAIDPAQASRDDPILTGLMKWATTVVVAPLLRPQRVRDDLAADLRRFPAEFLLFSPHVEQLGLEDRVSGSARAITLASDAAGTVVLNDANRRSVWVVRRQVTRPSKAALEDGGYAAARESVEIAWAAPLEGTPKGVGTFWAYFPTTSGTTLSGIVNAPWKLADDRESLLTGRFNDELLTEALPTLVGDALATIHRDSKPTAVLDVLPARGREWRNHADDILNEPVMRAVSARPCIPTLAGGLRHPTRVKLHPEGLEPEELRLWASVCPDPEGWASHAITSTEHRSKVTRLLGHHGRDAISLRDWVQHLVKATPTPTVEGSAVAVRLVASLIGRLSEPDRVDELKKARVLLLEDGSVDACRRGQVFLPGPTPQPDRQIINPVLAADAGVVSALGSLGIEVFDSAGELRSELTAMHVDWHRVWASTRKNSAEQSEEIFRDVLGDRLLERLQVRTYSGKWKHPGEVFLAGEVIPRDGSRDGDFLVDPRFHQQDEVLLQRLGLVSAPHKLLSAPPELWRTAKLASVRDDYRRDTDQQRLPDTGIDVDEGRVPWPLETLSRLSEEGRAALTAAVMRQLSGDERWRVSRSSGAGRPKDVDNPTWLYLRDHGRLRTAIGTHPVSRCLRRDEDGVVIDGVPQPLPYVESSVTNHQANALALKDDPGELRPQDWAAILDQAKAWEDDRRFLVYAWAAFLKQPSPMRIRVRRGPGFAEVPAVEVAVTCRFEVFTSLVTAGVPALLATSSTDFEALRGNWGMADGDTMLTETVDYELAGEAFTLTDRFPPLRNYLPVTDHDLLAQPCQRLELLTSTPVGQQSRPLAQHRDAHTIYITAENPREVLTQICRALDATFRPDRVLQLMEEQQRSKLRQEIAETADLLDKLVLAVGVDDLTAAVPAAAIDALRHDTARVVGDRDIAALALAVEGYAILHCRVAALKTQGLNPPSSWAGCREARDWVRGLGFPVEFAGFRGTSRDAEVEVEGPLILGDLNPYQRDLADRVRALLDPDAEMRRGLLWLPTGAGKTRVAVQALVEHMAQAQSDVLVIWLAETDELCEQALQTWSQVWRAQGKAGTPLTLSRLWATRWPTERGGHQVVVATLDKLDSVIKREGWQQDYGWLVNPQIIVVDEAHRSSGDQYTRTLSAVGGASRVADMTTPIVGLTATPFVGFDERRTQQLISRYHNNRLDMGVFPDDDVYGYLQGQGILARVQQRELRGADVVLTEAEIEQAKMRMPDSVEKRLGRDEERNTEIVRALLELGEDKTVLLFATSVENAKVLAALLTYHGVESRAVAGSTDANLRRRYVEDFKSGQVRVLTNYNVFTEGFDVPRVDAVFITRPTFSPNVYQQMIGRGLRGPRHGGTEEVLIVNVADNLTNFGQELAFRHFDHLWSRGTRT